MTAKKTESLPEKNTKPAETEPTKPTKPRNPDEKVCERCGATEDVFLKVKAYFVAEGGISPKRIFCDKCYIKYSQEVYEAHKL